VKEHMISFLPSSRETLAPAGRTILEAAREAGVWIDARCNGKGTCGKCRIRVVEGDAGVSEGEESRFISPADRNLGYRLACMARIVGDATILVPGEDFLTRAAAKKVFSRRSRVLNPAVKSYTVDLAEAGKGPSASLESLTGLLSGRLGLTKGLSADLPVLQHLADALKEGNDRVTLIVWMDREIIDVQPGSGEPCLGLALDVGTTTVAVYVCDFRKGSVISSGSVTNPQVLFGSDVMSRISYSSTHPQEGVRRMQRELVGGVNTLIMQMAANDGFRASRIMDMTVVGNTVMHHIFLGISPDRLGLWPFTPSVQGSVDVKARDLGILINPSAYVHVLPVEAGFVGADNVAVLISEQPYMRDQMSLIIDLGTNGEVVVGNRARMFSCSCATGPAFEGAHISSGVRATKGAIEKVRVDPATGEVDYAVVGTEGWASGHRPGELRPIGICGSGIIDTVAHLFKGGFIGEDGAFTEKHHSPRLRKGTSGVQEFVVAWQDEAATGTDIVLTQKDIRQIQLAKAALHAGCTIAMDRLGITAIERMVIAGAFGMHLDKENALTIGLFPWCDPAKISLVGNAAGHGAYLALVNREKREEADRVARSVTHIELALEEGFQRAFMQALSMPGALSEAPIPPEE